MMNPGIAAEQVRVAVASNFNAAIRELAQQFEQQTNHKVLLSYGSTGKHYAQIQHGAPFDIFLAADKERPALLEKQGLIQAGSRFTYAIGKLALWSPVVNKVDKQGNVLASGQFRHLALANPRLAPYGKAAMQVLEARGLWKPLQQKIVRGENIAQAFQFVQSGNAELGFIAYSQLKTYQLAFNKYGNKPGNSESLRPESLRSGSFWLPPESLYSPIEQQAVLLKDSKVARQFIDFIRSEQGRSVIQQYGYNVP